MLSVQLRVHEDCGHFVHSESPVACITLLISCLVKLCYILIHFCILSIPGANFYLWKGYYNNNSANSQARQVAKQRRKQKNMMMNMLFGELQHGNAPSNCHSLVINQYSRKFWNYGIIVIITLRIGLVYIICSVRHSVKYCISKPQETGKSHDQYIDVIVEQICSESLNDTPSVS